MRLVRHWLARVGVAVILLFALVLAGLMVGYPYLTHRQCYVITSGSMTGTIDQGSLIYDDVVPVSSLRVGDIITYSPPGHLPLVTHRIASIERDAGGTPVFITKGDANAARDPWKFTLDKRTQARYVFGIPCIGYAFAFLSLPIARVLLLVVPALVIAFLILRSLWNEAGEELDRRDTQATEPAGRQDAFGPDEYHDPDADPCVAPGLTGAADAGGLR